MHKMIRQETHKCDGQDGVDDPPCPAGGGVVDSSNAQGHDGVTNQDDHRGQKGSKNETGDAVRCQVAPLFLIETLKAHFLFR